MKFKPYPKYKDSGIEWLGEVPEHWHIKKIKHTSYLKGRVGWKGLTSDEYLEDGYSYLVTGTDFKNKYINWELCHCVEQMRYEDDPFIQLKNNDLLITKDGTIGKLALIKNLTKPACLNSGIFLIRPINSYITEYMYWILDSDLFSVFYDLSSIGSTIQHLYQNIFENFTFPVPYLVEQIAISNFLDNETRRIDTLIEEKIRFIELLKEKRQALISHAVTKGLDPTVKMKSSGVDWLEDIPEHWNVKKLKYLAKIKNGQDQKHVLIEEGGFPVYGSGGEFGRASQYLYNQISVLLGRKGTIDKPLFIEEPFWTVDTMYYTVISASVFPKFFFYQCLTIEFNYYQFGSTVPSMTQESLHNNYFSIPNLQEQTVIANFLDRQTTKIDTLIQETQTSITLLKEHRTALISAAVTGKIDVREAA